MYVGVGSFGGSEHQSTSGFGQAATDPVRDRLMPPSNNCRDPAVVRELLVRAGYKVPAVTGDVTTDQINLLVVVGLFALDHGFDPKSSDPNVAAAACDALIAAAAANQSTEAGVPGAQPSATPSPPTAVSSTSKTVLIAGGVAALAVLAYVALRK